MRLRFLALGALALVSVMAGPALAKPVFLAPSDYDPKILLPAPPPDNSPAAKAELAELQRIEASRTPEEFAAADEDDRTENATIFRSVIGDGFDLKALPATTKLLADVRNDEKEAAGAAKNFFLRNRPWIVDPSLKTCAHDDPPQSSYPSGHATMGYAMAVVLAALIPERGQAIMARAAVYAENRLVCSMHFRRDIVAGQTLGTAVGVMLLHDAKFRVEFDAAEAELKAAHLAK